MKNMQMKGNPKSVIRTYITLTLLSTLSASFIWGVNTLFLLDAGLSNTEAFAANAFFTVGQVIFEVPTGVVADTWGRRTSFLMGAFTLLVSTLLYLLMWQLEAPFVGWAISSAVIGLGFTFFSGAVEAWLVDALQYVKYEKSLESVFAKGQITGGAAMLTGSIAGGVVAQATNLGVPYILRAIMLGGTLIVAFLVMRDLGFESKKGASPTKEMKKVLSASVTHGLKNRPVRWLMLAAPFSAGVGFYAFYALQPYLLELYGDPEAYSIAGLAAAVIAGAQIAGGILVPYIRKKFNKRTTVLVIGLFVSVLSLAIIGLTDSFWVAVAVMIVWAMVFAASGPVRQAYINGLIPSKQRATVLSFDSLMSSTGGVVSQPALGRVADVWSYSTSYLVAAAIQLGAIPFTFLSRNEKSKADIIESDD